MSIVSESYFEDWSDFKATFHQHLPGWGEGQPIKGHFLFRGQASSEWGLVASFDRYISDPNLKARIDLNRRCLSDLFRQLRALDYNVDELDDAKVAALGQHFGMPTRLLDWSESPYVAAYFAFESALNYEHDGLDSVAVWVLNRDNFNSSIHSSQARIVDVLDIRNPRLGGQRGVFTEMFADTAALDDLLTRSGPVTDLRCKVADSKQITFRFV